MEDTQNPIDLMAVINAAVAASLEKAIAKVLPTASDALKPVGKTYRTREDTEESDDSSRERQRPAKRHWKGEESRKAASKIKTLNYVWSELCERICRQRRHYAGQLPDNY
ncbi:Hypothetical predicted protein [Pelobates cultripes]|uniref:Uncharacterized protein n=1 Tax=Pelobates cultripes TaxID=61616 RepID=A0AAD1WL98_PELCU|nr:Hypothetical predicted protein [Pelobates cultripes]